MFWPCETRTSTCRSFATISSGLYRFLAIAVLLDVKDIPQVGPLQWGWITWMELSERAWQLGLLAEPAPGAAPRRSPRAAFPSPGPRPPPATLTRRLRRSATEGNGGRKAATHLHHAHPPHALALAHECPRQIVEHSLPGVP